MLPIYVVNLRPKKNWIHATKMIKIPASKKVYCNFANLLKILEIIFNDLTSVIQLPLTAYFFPRAKLSKLLKKYSTLKSNTMILALNLRQLLL